MNNNIDVIVCITNINIAIVIVIIDITIGIVVIDIVVISINVHTVIVVVIVADRCYVDVHTGIIHAVVRFTTGTLLLVLFPATGADKHTYINKQL